jgi:hypothetical protein
VFGGIREHGSPPGWVGRGRRSWVVEQLADPGSVEKKQVTRDKLTARSAPRLGGPGCGLAR